jgi:hypothetical protein
MRVAYGAWTGLCLGAVLGALVISPEWEDGSFLPGDAIFAVIALGAALLIWIIGLVLTALAETVFERRRTERKLAPSSGQRPDYRTRLSPTEKWTMVVLVFGSVGWIGLYKAWYDPESWLLPVGAREAAALATLLALPISLVVWLVGVAVVRHRGR